MINLLYTNGCSWTAGNGIEQDPSLAHLPIEERWKKFSTLSWPNLVADKLNVDVINESLGATSNKRMVRTTVNFLKNYKGDYSKLLVILGWTSVDRSEIYVEEDNQRKGWIMFNCSQPASSHGKFWLHDLSDNYVKKIDKWQKDYIIDIYSSYERFHQYFLEMFLMKHCLENYGIKYIFFNSLTWKNYDFSWSRTPNFNPVIDFANDIKNLQCANLLNLRDCDESLNVMHKFCTKNNLPMAPDGHTMIEGHARWADHLYQEILNVYTELKE